MPFNTTKRILKHFRQESRVVTPYRVNQWFKWLSPGLSVKRWVLISASGVCLVGLGLAIWIKLTPIFYAIQLIQDFLSTITTILPSYISGPLVLLIGFLLILWGQSRTVGSITEVFRTNSDEELIDLLLNYRRLNRGPKLPPSLSQVPTTAYQIIKTPAKRIPYPT